MAGAFGDGDGFHGCREFHPFTVSGIGPGGALKLDIKALGPCTRHLQHLTPGVTLRLEGPFGDFLAAAGDGPQLWLAGGIGIAPFLAVLRSRLPAQPTHLIHLFRHADDAGFSDEIQALAAGSPNLSFVPVASGEAAARAREPSSRRTGTRAAPTTAVRRWSRRRPRGRTTTNWVTAMSLVERRARRVLVADDVADSGRTMQLVIEILVANGAEVRTAVLYTKPTSVFRVDFAWKQTDAWIVFPWSALPPVTAG